MNNRKIIKIILGLLLLVGLVLLLITFASKPKYILSIPNSNDVSSIQFNKKDELGITLVDDEDSISKVINSLNGVKREKVADSINDAPYNDQYTQITIYDKEKISQTIYIYKKNNKYYVEQPYIGIYKMTETEYNSIVTRGYYD